MFIGRVDTIHISSKPSSSMQAIQHVQAVAGEGLEGDRYFQNPSLAVEKEDVGRQVTLIEIEAIEAIQRESGITLPPGEARRNLVTRGVPLNHLVGVEFQVGDATMRGVRLCEPCQYLENLTQPGVRESLIHRGGLRAEIMKSGTIHIGDEIRIKS